MKFIAISFSLFLITSTSLFADEMPSSIDFFTQKGIKGKFIKIHDPGYIVIELDSGDIIDTTYTGIEFDTLYNWQKQDIKTGRSREMSIIYNNAQGVLAKDLKSGVTFQLSGVIKTHPIDLAVDKCANTYSSTLGIKHCQQLQLQAWDAELNRAYKDLGGSKKAELKKSQLAWIAFRDAQIGYLSSEYGQRQGSIWGIVYLDQVVNITKEQANRLKSIKEW